MEIINYKGKGHSLDSVKIEYFDETFNCIAIPKDITNGNMIERMFPDEDFKVIEKVGQRVVRMNSDKCIEFDLDWWNSKFTQKF